MRIPFGVYSELPVKKTDSSEKIHEFMDKSQKILDEAVYGMKDAKVQFMQILAQWVANPLSIGNAIALKGPMGTGKTTLIKYGVSKLLNREFAFIPLGGATDSSYLEGHSYTYEGSTYGKIIDILIQCKTSNPVIYFDELDKVSDTPKGEEITIVCPRSGPVLTISIGAPTNSPNRRTYSFAARGISSSEVRPQIVSLQPVMVS